MFGDIIQPTHLLFILVVALLVLGPKRLPEVGRSLGKGLSSFRQGMQGVQDEARGIFGDALDHTDQKPASAAPSTLPQAAAQPDVAATAVQPNVAHGAAQPSVAPPAVQPSMPEPVVSQPAMARTLSEPDPADYAD